MSHSHAASNRFQVLFCYTRLVKALFYLFIGVSIFHGDECFSYVLGRVLYWYCFFSLLISRSKTDPCM